MRTLAIVLLLAACGGSSSQTVDAPKGPDDAAPIDVALDAKDPRGPATFTLTGGANGLLWDAATSTLYLADNNANALVKWTDAGGLQQVGTFPPATAGISLGDIVKRGDGTILTTSFGFAMQGTLFAMTPNNTSSAPTGLDPARRRIGLAQDAAGMLYVAYFTGGMGMQTGGVASVEITGTAATETELAGGSTNAGFKKVVGVAATAEAVYVADQTQKTIFKIALPSKMVTTHASALPSADLLTLLPNGDLLTGGTGVHRITPAGVVSTILQGFEQVHGIAYDSALKRLFIIEHSATVGVPDKLHVRPFDL